MQADPLIAELARLAGGRARRDLLRSHPSLHHAGAVEALYDEVVKLTRVDLQQADRLAQAARWLASRLRDDGCRAQAWRATGHVFYARGRYEEALVFYRKALEILRLLGREVDAGRTLSGALHSLIYLGRYEEALEWAREAREIFERAGDRLRLARLDSNAGNILYRQDRFPEALALYRRAYEELRTTGALQDVAAVLSNMAVCSISLNDFPQALEYYRQARTLCQDHDMPLLVAEADYNIAYLHYLRGEYALAIELYKAARDESRRLHDRYHEALCDLDQAEMYLELNLADDGAELAARALEHFRQLGMGYEAAKAMAFLAIASSHQGRQDRALELFGAARRLFVREQNRVWPALLDLYQALVLFREGRYARARRLCRAALRFFRALPLPGKAALSELLLARLDLREGRLQAALETCHAARARLDTAQSPALSYQAWFVLGKIHEAAGRRDEACEAYRRAHTQLEDLRSHLRGEQLKIAFVKDKLEVYESLVSLCLADESGPDRRAAAFGFIEQAKSRSLADLIAFQAQELPGAATGSDALVARARRLREDLNWHYRQIESQEIRPGDHGPAYLGTLRVRARECERELAGTLECLRGSDQEFASLQNPAAAGVDAVRAALPHDTLLLEYYEARGTLYACVLGRSRLEFAALGPSAPVRDLFSLLRFQLSKFRLGPEYTRAFAGTLLAATQAHLRGLYDALVAPVRRLLDAPRLVVVPHGFLHYVPFHALSDGSACLIDSHLVSYAPSAGVYALCCGKIAPAAAGSLVMGVPDALAPHIRDEAQAVAECLPGARLFVGQDATSLRLQQHGPHSRWVHIATHGLFRQDNPMFSSIRLGDSQLTLFDLYRLRLPAELITLSGCGTGLNVVVGGDELLGLVRGLLYAGARSVMASLWDVDDRSTADFMRAFYRQMACCPDKAAALQSSMQILRERYPHPYHWAPFILVGAPVARS